jgi:hypothetical protein
MSNDRDQEMAYAFRRWQDHGERQYCVYLPDDRQIFIVASKLEFLPNGVLVAYSSFKGGPDEINCAWAAGEWQRVWMISALDGSRSCLIDDSDFWQQDESSLPETIAPALKPIVRRELTEEERRRCKERNRIGPKARFRILQRDSYTCKACGRGRDDDVVLHVDHIVAIASGGTSDDENLQTLCADCNQGKGAA